MTCREVPLDARAILQALARHQVDYVVIGGVAVQAHGHTRTTQDLDLVPRDDPENLNRLVAALAALRARPVGEPKPGQDELRLPATGTLELDTDAGGLDIHLSPPGAAPYDQLKARSLRLELGDLQLLVAGLDDLIAMKRASGRPIDQGDILALTDAR